MAEEKKPPASRKPAAVDPVKDPAVFDEFAKQASETAVWSDAVKAQLPKKPQ